MVYKNLNIILTEKAKIIK